jgi:hypothetical protein
MTTDPAPHGTDDDFARRAAEKPPGLLRDLWGMLRRNKKWWLTPIVLVLLLVGALLVLSATPLGPFLYPLF